MPEVFQYDIFFSPSAKDKAVVRPLAERGGQDGLTVRTMPRLFFNVPDRDLASHPVTPSTTLISSVVSP